MKNSEKADMASYKYHLTSMVIHIVIITVFCFFSSSEALLELTSGDSFYSAFWTQSSHDSGYYGYYGLTNIIGQQKDDNATIYNARLKIEGSSWWRDLAANSFSHVEFVFENSKPDPIIRCSGRFNEIPWIRLINLTTDNDEYSIRFYFPILPTKQSYDLYDYFTVPVNDTVSLEFYAVSNYIFTGTFTNSRDYGNGQTKIYAKNAIAVRTSPTYPFRIKHIQINGAFKEIVSEYLNFDLSELREDGAYFGVQMVDTVIDQGISVESIALKGFPKLLTDSTYRISCSLSGAMEIEICSVYVSLDSGNTWEFAVSTQARDKELLWKTPSEEYLHCFLKVRVTGINGFQYGGLSSEFTIRPTYTFSLDATPYDKGGIVLVWNPPLIAIPNAESICIAYQKEKPVTDITSSGIDTALYDLNTARDTISGLQTGAVYYFSAFVIDSTGAYHFVPGKSIVSALIPDDGLVDNLFTLQGRLLDSTRVILSWSSSGEQKQIIDSVAILYNHLYFPASLNDSLSSFAGVYAISDTCDTLTNLQQNKDYYFSLFVSDTLGNWSTAAQKGMQFIRTGFSSGHVVTLGADTQIVIEDSLFIWSKEDLFTSFLDTLDRWQSPKLKGFVQSGLGFSFRKGALPPNTTIGIKLAYRNIPQTLSETDQRVYRYNIYTGKWRLHEHPIFIDTINHAIITGTDDASLPFIVMIDTLRPFIKQNLNKQNTFSTTQGIVDTFSISDNIENVSIQLYTGAGDGELSDVSQNIISNSASAEYVTTIPPYAADECSGLRAELLVSDGLFTDTINLSRSIERNENNCDNIKADRLKWTPLFVTARPDNPLLPAALSPSADEADRFKYNKKEMRILQWISLPRNEDEENKWVEYGPKNDSLFQLNLGKLFWMKTKTGLNVNYGKAVVPALKDTFKISLKGKEWTDFSIPFNFDLPMSGILESTEKLLEKETELPEIYRWSQSESSYMTEPVFLPGILDLEGLLDTIHGGRGYSAYNPSNSTISLLIPPVAVKVSPADDKPGLKKMNNASSWYVKIRPNAHPSEALPPIYCASIPVGGVKRYYPTPPSLSSVNVCVLNQISGQRHGHAASGDLSQGGAMFTVLCENSAKKSRTVFLAIEKETGLPRNMKSGFYNAGSNENGSITDALKIQLAPRQKGKQVVLIGDANYIEDFSRLLSSKLKFLAIPLYRGVKLVYTVPYNTQSTDFTMFDIKGRRLWERHLAIPMLSNSGYFYIPNIPAKGFYIVEMKAKIEGTQKPEIIRQKLAFFR